MITFQQRIIRILASIGTCIALMVACAITATPAQAEALTHARQEDFHQYVANGMLWYFGVVGYDSADRRYYCADQSQMSNYVTGNATTVPDSDQARQIAALIRKYQMRNNSDFTQAALAVIVHDAFDTSTGADGWPANRAILQKTPQIFTRVNELLNEAPNLVPKSMATELTYAEGRRSGSVRLHVRNVNGGYVEGVPYTLKLEGPAVLSNGSREWKGTTGAQPAVMSWQATGDGIIKVTGSATVPSLDLVESSQNLIRLGGGQLAAINEVEAPVQYTFAPQLRTVTSPKEIQEGDTVSDEVTVITPGSNNVWPTGATITARGWYFDGISVQALEQPMSVQQGESVQAFLQRLKLAGFAPVGYAKAQFQASNQTVNVQAMSTQDGNEPYQAGRRSGLGTWLWAIERDQQAQAARNYLTGDSVSAFLEQSETNVTRAIVHVQSKVNEHTAHIGAELMDVIEVSGFPEDHGAFQGNTDFELGADEMYAQVRVWWSGSDVVKQADGDDADSKTADDSSDTSNEEGVDPDEAYRPQGDAEPQEDEHHQLIGQWDVRAVNGTIRIGGGVKDAHEQVVNIRAERAGWYVFVWSFEGDGRVMPAASSYADAWERVRVVREHEPTPEPTPQEPEPEPSEEPTPPAAVEEPTPQPIQLIEPAPTPRAESEPVVEPTVEEKPIALAKTGVSDALPVSLSAIMIAIAIILIVQHHRKMSIVSEQEEGNDNE